MMGTHATILHMEQGAERDTGNGPLYEMIARELIREMDEGLLRPGDRLPSIRELGRRKAVGINTIIRAYRTLERARRVEFRPRSGCFVLSTAPPLKRNSAAAPQVPERRTAETSALWYQVHDDAGRHTGAGFGMISIDPALIPAAALNRALASAGRRFPGRCTASSAVDGEERLRMEISWRYARRGCTVSPEEMLITGGCSDALFLALMALTSPGDSIVVEQPFFTSALKLWESLGLNIIEVAADPADGMDTGVLARILAEPPSGRIAAVVVVSSFANPLGSTLPVEKRKELARLAALHDVPVIEDDIFGELPFSDLPAPPVKAFDRGGNVILVSSFSKCLAPGYRTGWIMPGKYYRRIRGLKMAAGSGAASPQQLALADVMEEGGLERHLRRVRQAYHGRMEALSGAVERSFPAGTRVNRPAGGLALWVELPEGADVMRLYPEARRRSLHFLPGPLFTLTGGFRNALRLSFSRWSGETPAAVEELGNLAAHMCFQKR